MHGHFIWSGYEAIQELVANAQLFALFFWGAAFGLYVCAVCFGILLREKPHTPLLGGMLTLGT
jgi:hypothetical protein